MAPGLLSFRRAFLALLLVGLASVLPAGDGKDAPSKPKTVRLLTVGNSFSQNATRFLPDLVKASGDVLIHHPAAIGGGTMAQHCEKYAQHEADPKDPRGFYSTKRSLKQELTAEPWDFVTIQQASIRSHDVATYRPFAQQLQGIIKAHAPGAELLVHETWAYRSDDKRFEAATNAKAGEPATRKEMYRGLAKAYGTITGELNARIIPSGDAFDLADSDPKWGYKPDMAFIFKTARHPALPDQTHSLHAGWRWSAGPADRSTLKMDGHHASDAGQYLAACAFYEVLYGKSVVGNSFVPKTLDPAYARFLQATAHQAVAASREKANPPKGS